MPETNTNLNPQQQKQREERIAGELANEGIQRSSDIMVNAMDCAHSWIQFQGSVWHFFGDNLQSTARLLTSMTQQAADRARRANH